MKAAPSIAFLLMLALSGACARGDSLWTSSQQGEHGLTADRKASRTGDILTITVAENATASNSQQRKDSRTSALQDSVGQFLFSPSASKLGTHNGVLPSINISGSSSFNGGGQVDNSQTATASAAVLVIDVLPNGNLVIEGVHLVTFAGETQYVVLHGIVRPDDISPNNTILSANIADARIEFYNQGSLTDMQKRGWLSKLYEKLRPF
jgi:flagellar L-ring protein precursor FlgH